MEKQVTTIQECFDAQGIDPKNLPDMSMLPSWLSEFLMATLEEAVMVKTVNEGWEPSFQQGERRWTPFHWLDRTKPAGLGLSLAVSIYDNAAAYVGSRLCFQSEEKSDFAGRNFIEIYEKTRLIKK